MFSNIRNLAISKVLFFFRLLPPKLNRVIHTPLNDDGLLIKAIKQQDPLSPRFNSAETELGKFEYDLQLNS